MDNAAREQRGEEAFDMYLADHPDHTDMEHSEEGLIDLLTDLRHFCASNALDFNIAVKMSQIHFEEE